MKDKIEKILEKSVNAPSGDNSQPWEFKINENKIFVYVKPDIDLPFYNYEQKASLFACGCLIENIVIVASYFGLKANAILFPDKKSHNLVAQINLLEDSNIKKDSLFDFIEKRVTNRKFYKDIPLSDEQKQKLIQAAKLVNYDARVIFVDNKNDIARLAKAFTINERIVLETEKIHKIFFKHVIWTNEEENRKKTGLFVKTLEMKRPEEFIFKLCRNWPVMNFLNKFGMSKLIANENAKRFAASAALGAIVVKNNNKEDFVYAGRIMERIWLKAASFNLAIHPITGVIFLMQRVWAHQDDDFKDHVPELIKSYNLIKEIFKISNGEVLSFIFRIGYADEPSAKSSKLPPKIIN